jgi:3'-phosphoadenosine 5'-phosphosulfate sulfotransferase (PAPS reductase)/FAD synthetase
VAALSSAERERRVEYLTDQANSIHSAGIAAHLGGREIHSVCVLFSGGNDSTTLTHLFREQATHAIHANTGIGIEQTRQFVRDICRSWGLPLVEVSGDDSYEDLVLGRVLTKRTGEPAWGGGFPGPAAHGTMYQRLKERALDKARHELGVANSRSKVSVWIAGRRRQESTRRSEIPLHERDGTVIWTSPIALWTKLDLGTYRQMHDVPRNEVADLLHMSGECLCGAYAHPGELDEIGDWFPETRAHIEDLQRKVKAAGYPEPFCRWGHGERGAGRAVPAGRLCESCDARAEAI